MADLSIDTAQVNFVNQLKRQVFIWTHYEECYKCPYMPKPLVLNENANKSKEFTSYYTLKYAVTEAKNSSAEVLCEGILGAEDQSIHEIIISSKSTVQCTLNLIEPGRNNLWTLLGTAAILLLLIVTFYTGRYLYKRKRKEGKTEDDSEDLKNKVRQRLDSLDAFRGMTVLMMIFVNWGSGEYHFLEHIEWDGLRFADVIFPFFIFIMGATMAISLRNQVIKKNLPLSTIFSQIIQRSIKLFILGLMVNSKGKPDVRTLRILGVLQRFSISYLVVASTHVLSLRLNRKKLNNDILPYWPDWILAIIMAAIYFPITFLWQFDSSCPVGYIGVGGFSENASYPYCIGGAANKIDRMIFTENHIYEELLVGVQLYDPKVAPGKKMFGLRHDCEGVLGYTMSIILTVIGLQVGKIMVTYSKTNARVTRLAIWTVLLAALTAALAWPNFVPINKNLWSFTFVTINGAIATAIFTLFYLLIDHFRIWRLGHPLNYPGMNAILLYMGHEFTENVFPFFYITEYTSHVWPLTQDLTGVGLWLLISVYCAKKQFFVTL